MVFALIRANPTLAPLFVAVGSGIGGALGFGAYYLAHNQDVVINKVKYPQPWNNVKPHENTKLFTWNKDFWSSRVGLPDPRHAFLGESASSPSLDKIKAIKKKAKEAQEAAVAKA